MTKEGKETGCFYYGVFQPRVMEHVKERHIPDSLNVLNNLAKETLPRKIRKDECQGKWITLEDGRHVCIYEEKDFSYKKTAYIKFRSGKKRKLSEHSTAWFDVGVSKEDRDMVTNLYNYASEDAKEELNNIYMTDKPGPKFGDIGIVGGVPEWMEDFRSEGFKTSRDSIYMFKEAPDSRPFTVAHEIGHIESDAMSKDKLNSYYRLSNKHSDVRPDIEVTALAGISGTNKEEEDFAVAYSIFRVEPETLEEIAPHRYKWLTKNIRSSKE